MGHDEAASSCQQASEQLQIRGYRVHWTEKARERLFDEFPDDWEAKALTEDHIVNLATRL